MPLILQIIIFVLVLSFLVIIHELGHLVAAKWAKIKIEEFGIGYPPRAFTLFHWGKILFSLNLIPVGGFVKMLGEDGGAADAASGPAVEEDEDGLAPFYSRSRKKRLVVIVAGVTVNLVFGLLAFAWVYYFKGIPTPITTARIGYVVPGSPAEQAGLLVDSEIVAITVGESTQAISTPAQAIEFINAHKGEAATITTTAVCRTEVCPTDRLNFSVKLRADSQIQKDEGSLGVSFADFVYKFYPWYEMPWRSMWFGVSQALFMVVMIVVALVTMIAQLFQGALPQNVAGPIGIVDQAASSGLFSAGFLAILNFAGMISINLAVMNLLPIPALDGGRALFIFLEKFFGKKRVSVIENYANAGGMFLLLTLIGLITIADVVKIVRR